MSDFPKLKLTYTDSSHSYYMNGRRAKSVSGVAKIPADSYTIEQWDRRQVAIGLTLDNNLIQTIAMDLDNRDAINDVVQEAKRVAGSHRKADRGTQMHRVLELVLLDREAELLTDQQRRDAVVLKRTLDRYKLSPVDDFMEQFVAWPKYTICGRFDAVLERSDGSQVLVDLKGLALDTKLPTPDGWTTMRDVQPGDRLFGSDGRVCNVTAKSSVKRIGTYIVEFDDGSKVICDSEHVWPTTTVLDRRNGRDPSVRTMREIIDTLDYMGYQKQHWVAMPDVLDLPEADLPIDPYLLGVWLGDGHHKQGTITKEAALFDLLESDGHQLGLPYVKKDSGGTVARVPLGLLRKLRDCNLFGNKHVPDAYLRASASQRLRLVQGLMDTDGTWNIKRKTAVFNSTDKGLAVAMEQLLLTLGQRPNLAEFQASGYGKTVTAYAVEFTPVDMEPFRLPRKRRKSHKTNKSLAYSTRRLIVSVEPGPDVETACVSVDSADNTYLCTERMIPTHNSGRNAVKYPQPTSVQLALYARAPMVSQSIHQRGERTVVEEWRTMPDKLDRTRAYVLLVEPDDTCGTFHRIDIEHGWAAAKYALGIVNWRKQLNYGKDIAVEVEPEDENPTDIEDFDDELHQQYLAEAKRARDRDVCVALWRSAKSVGVRTDELKHTLRRRVEELGV